MYIIQQYQNGYRIAIAIYNRNYKFLKTFLNKYFIHKVNTSIPVELWKIGYEKPL